jgi:hypothetical protein
MAPVGPVGFLLTVEETDEETAVLFPLPWVVMDGKDDIIASAHSRDLANAVRDLLMDNPWLYY